MAISAKIPVVTVHTTDTAPTLQFTVNKNDGSGAQDLTGATVKCHLRLIGETSNVFAGAQENATIVGAGAGRVDWSWPSGGLTDPGIYYGQLEITFTGGQIQHTQRFQIEAREAL